MNNHLSGLHTYHGKHIILAGGGWLTGRSLSLKSSWSPLCVGYCFNGVKSIYVTGVLAVSIVRSCVELFPGCFLNNGEHQETVVL